MKKATAVLAFCVCIALTLPAQTKPSKHKKAASGGLTKEHIQQSLDAWSTMDPSKIAPFYSQAPDNTFYDITPMEYHGWSEWAAGISKFFADFQSFKLSMTEEPKIHNAGDWAWTTYLWHADGVHKDGKSETIDGRDTAVWHKEAGKWVVVHEHASVPLPAPAQ